MSKPTFFLLISIFLFSLSLNVYFFINSYQRQIVVQVPDGDSLDLQDGRRIRLLGIDAPEKGRCGSDFARDKLISLVKGKHVRLTDIVKDDYGRQLANVVVNGILINRVLVEEGLVKYTSVTSPQSVAMRQAADSAKNASKGIYSFLCRSTQPQNNCVIKGNKRDSQLTYHLPTCSNYNQTIVDLSYGDSWFCTEKEAQDAGYKKAAGCR